MVTTITILFALVGCVPSMVSSPQPVTGGAAISSDTNMLMVNFPSPWRAGTLIHVQSAKGQELVTFAPTKDYQSFVFSSPELDKGMTCVVYSGGTCSGQLTDGLYEGGPYATGQ